MGRWSRGKPRMRWLNTVEEDFKTPVVLDWKEIVRHWEKRREVVMATKTIIEL